MDAARIVLLYSCDEVSDHEKLPVCTRSSSFRANDSRPDWEDMEAEKGDENPVGGSSAGDVIDVRLRSSENLEKDWTDDAPDLGRNGVEGDEASKWGTLVVEVVAGMAVLWLTSAAPVVPFRSCARFSHMRHI